MVQTLSLKTSVLFSTVNTISSAESVSTLRVFAIVSSPAPRSAAWIDQDIEFITRTKIVDSTLMCLNDIVTNASHTGPTVVRRILTSKLEF